MLLALDRPPRPRVDAATVKLAAQGRETEIIGLFRGEPNQRLSSRNELRWGNHGSLALALAKDGLWYDHEAGQGGDIITFVQVELGCSFREALQWLSQQLGVSVRHEFTSPIRRATRQASVAADEEDKLRRLQAAQEIWEASQPAVGTPAERYLASRGLALPPFDVLSFHPACPWKGGRLVPSMIAPITDIVTGELVAIQKTALTEEGKKIERRNLGPVAGDGFRGAIRLIEADDAKLVIAEGVETALSVLQVGMPALGAAAGGWSIWSVLDVNGMKSFPVLGGVEQLMIIADNDVSGTGQAAAADCMARWEKAGKRACRVIPPEAPGHEARGGTDLNDCLQMLGRGGRGVNEGADP
jgi:putative DNA primase/helicase